MKRVRHCLTFAVVALLSGCGLFASDGRYRFRLTAEVNTSRGRLTGSSVYEVTAYRTLKLTSEEKAGGGGLRGQATIVETPEGPLFLLLKTNTANEGIDTVATIAMRPEAMTGHVEDYIAAVRSLGGWFGRGQSDLPRDKWPLIVRFRNLRDSTSVELADPAAVGVERIFVETTREPVTTGIERFLPWLTEEGKSLDPRSGIDFSGHPPLARRLRQRDFKTAW